MNKKLARISLAIAFLSPVLAHAAAECELADKGVHYKSLPFDFSGSNLAESAEAQSFFEYVRRTYPISDNAIPICRDSIYSVAKQKELYGEPTPGTERTVTIYGTTMRFVQTSFRPKSR